MKYSTVIDRLQKFTNSTPSVGDLSKATGLTEKNLYARRTYDREFSEDETKKIEAYYEISLLNGDDCIEIDHIHINPSCGKGTVVLEDAIATPVKIGREIIKDLWHVQNPNVLKLFKASGDSMADTIEDGNILLVDTSRTDYQNGGIYLLTINNDWFIKRLRKRLSGELDVISDNSKYPIETFKPNDDIEVVVKGRVIKNLSRGL